jgi:hypothetical protein
MCRPVVVLVVVDTQIIPFFRFGPVIERIFLLLDKFIHDTVQEHNSEVYRNKTDSASAPALKTQPDAEEE